MKQLRDLNRKVENRNPAPPPRGLAAQYLERQREQFVRNRAVELGRELVDRGWSWPDAAGFLHLQERTLRQWRYDRLHYATLVPLGRPAQRASRDQRNEVIHLIDELGPGIGLPTLRALFPLLARAELANLLARYRRVWRRRHGQPLRVLHWHPPGAVWAIDFSEQPDLVDGRWRYLLAVRDLASSQQLLWQSVPAPDAAAAHAALAALFRAHGAPLVLKSDNGSAFGAGLVQKLLHQHDVENLFSPPGMPRYNGAIEAGIGSLKTRTEQHAVRHDRPGQWISDDLAAAVGEANATTRPRGENGPAPDQLWAERHLLTVEERTLFRATVGRLRVEIDATAGAPPDERERRARDRQAIRRALEAHGYLTYTRRRIALPIPRPIAASIT